METIKQSENHKTLARAIEAANLTQLLKGYSDGSFTLFAPTDEAFSQLPEGTAEDLLRPENQEELLALVAYHFTSYGVTADQLRSMEAGDAAQGDPLFFSTSGDHIVINEKPRSSNLTLPRQMVLFSP